MIKSILFALFVVSAAAAPRVTVVRAPDNGLQPQAVAGNDGTVHLIYFKGDPKGGDILYVRREVGRKEFSKPIPVNTQARTTTAIGTIRGAQLAVGKRGRVHVVWNGMGEGASLPSPHQSDAPAPLFYTRLNGIGTAFERERNIITYAWGLDGGSSVAADAAGNVYVAWHAPQPGNTNGEAGRAVYIARSNDEGKTFEREAPAISKRTGACACCGMRMYADSQGDLFALYRAANERTNRDETLLISRNKGLTFEVAYSHHWNLGACPMTSASFSESSGQILAAAETHGRVFFIKLDPVSGRIFPPVSPETQAKYPIAVANTRSEVLLVWAEGTGWNKGGSVAWQIYDREGQPLSSKGRAEGLTAWSLPTAFVEPDGGFTIIY